MLREQPVGSSTRARPRRLVGHGPHLAVPEIQLLTLLQVERPRAAPAEHRDLVSAFVDAAVAAIPFRYANRSALRVLRDHARIGPRAEAEIPRHTVGRS